MATDNIQFPTYPDLKGKVMFLTGIGQTGDQNMWGNGAATARILPHNGARIFGCDLHLETGKHTESRIRAEGGEIYVTSADVTRDASVKTATAACLDRYGRIDILVNNVGRSEPGGPAEMSEATWNAQMDVNLKSVGAIVNVASIAGLRYIGKPQVAYSATKVAVIQFTKATAVIYAARGIRKNVVVPDLMNTPLVGLLADKYAGGDLAGVKAKRNKAVPMGHMGESWDVAMTAAFLVSQQARYITGQKIVVDGGITSSTG